MKRPPVIRVSDVMLREVDMVCGQDTVSEALAKMKHVNTRMLMVEKRHEDDEYGLVRLGDIARQVLAKDRSPDRVNIYEIMSKPVISVPMTMDIRYCARLFEQFGLQRAPVIQDGEVLGVIGYDEMLMHWLKLGQAESRNPVADSAEVVESNAE